MGTMELSLRIFIVPILISQVIGLEKLEDMKNVLLPSSTLRTNFSNLSTIPISLDYLGLICARDVTTRNISDLCASQMQIVCNNLDIRSSMSDAWSRYPYVGSLTATREDFGAFDQCINIEHQPEEGPRILGKHCVYGLALPLNDTYLLSYCVPDGCSALDLTRLIQIDPIPEELLGMLINDKICSTKESNKTLEMPSIIVAALFCLFFGLVVLSTAYEVFLYKRQIKNRTPLLTAFSAFTNGKKLTQSTDGRGSVDQILALHGIKVISMMWILAGHAGSLFVVLPLTNRDETAQFQTSRSSILYLSAHLAVDTFFFVSGFLLAYQYFKGLAHKPVAVQIKAVPSMIIHRYLRVTPVVLMMILYLLYLAPHIGNGPLLPIVSETVNKPCREHWWAVFLYIQNYYNPRDLCWVHLWYLSTDWQLFLVAPLVLIPMAWQFRRRFNAVLLGIALLNVFFIILPIFTKLMFPDFDPTRLEYDAHSKLITYFLGVMFGFYLRCKRDKPYLFRNGYNLIMWCIALAVIFAAIFIYTEIEVYHNTHVNISLRGVFIKPFWCFSLAFVIYSSTYGYGGVINWILTAKWLQVFSKLTYCMYILHVPVILFWLGTKRTRDYFNNYNAYGPVAINFAVEALSKVLWAAYFTKAYAIFNTATVLSLLSSSSFIVRFFYFCGHFVISLIVSIIWTLMFEAPLITIERVLLKGGGAKPRQKDKPKETITIIHKPPMGNDAI